MVYGSIPTVRSLAGIKQIYEHGIKLYGTVDGSNAEFKLPAVGDRKGFLVDLNADKTSTITISDIVVYSNGTPVSVSSIDEEQGTVILSSAPTSGATITADYMWSEVSDTEVIECMNIATEMVQYIIRGDNETSLTYTQEIDGDGVEKEFEFDHSDVTSVDTVTVDGRVLTEGTDYYLYKYPRSSRYWYIRFDVPPRNKEKICTIAYTHGESKYTYSRLANLYAARQLLIAFLRPDKRGGTFKKGQNPRSRADTTRLVEINKEIMEIISFVDKRKRFGST